MHQNMYDVSLNWKLKILQKYFIVYTPFNWCYFSNYQIPSSAQDTTYSIYTNIAFKMVIPPPR